MPESRFAPDWHHNDASTFARLVGSSPATPIGSNDPVHRARIERYERNITYYLGSQYNHQNLRAAQNEDFLAMRVNYSSIAQRSIDLKADWLFGKPIGINVVPQEEDGTFTDEADTANSIQKVVKDRINQIREYNHSVFWDYIMATMGMICGDFFVLVDADVDDDHPTIQIYDPSFVFPDYPRDINKPMRACQIQYSIDGQGNPDDEEGLYSRRITEDYRLELVNSTVNDGIQGWEELNVLSDEEMALFYTEDGSMRPELDEEEGLVLPDGEDIPRLTCIYRKFEDGVLVEDSYRDVGIPAIPIVHGLNSRIWNTRYGNDELSVLIPLIEKYNEMFFYAERVARQNSHAKLFVSGTKSETAPIQSDYDDIIYGGTDARADVISLPSDTGLLKLVTDTIEREMHRAAGIPVIAEGEAEMGYGAPSGLALMIRFGPLQALTHRHQLPYGDALSAVYTLCLMLDEMVIQGQPYGEIYEYDTWKFKYDWYDAMPKAISEMITDMQAATGGKQLVSVRTAQEMIPGVDPDQEQKRLTEETAQAGQQSLDTLATGDGSTPPGVGPDGQPLPAAAPGSFPSRWTIRKKVIRDEFGRIDSVEETMVPVGAPAPDPTQDPSLNEPDLFGLTGPPAALPAATP